MAKEKSKSKKPYVKVRLVPEDKDMKEEEAEDDEEEKKKASYKAEDEDVKEEEAEHSPCPAHEKTAEGPCWEGYEMIGMKDKGGKRVPNCVKKLKMTWKTKRPKKNLITLT